MKNILTSLVILFQLTSAGAQTASFDLNHESFTEILQDYVVFEGEQSFVNYKALKSKKITLLRYLATLSRVSEAEFNQLDENDQIAYLINLYNAATLKLIIDNFTNAWGIEFIKLFGGKVSLDHIEKGLLLKNYSEPRVHFAVNCASIGCPSLIKEAYVGRKLNEQLENAAILFFNDKEKNNYNKVTKTLTLSKIFDWYQGDFRKKFGSVSNYVADYITEDEAHQNIIKTGKARVIFSNYDWSLNDTQKVPGSRNGSGSGSGSGSGTNL